MRWVYILHCENDTYYVGQTSRLYRRFWEHESGKGGVNTFENPPEEILAIYPVNRLGNFIKYKSNIDNNMCSENIYFKRGIINDFDEDEGDEGWCSLFIEDFITEKLMIDNKDKIIIGGKYIR
jgi:hypothetical protein